MRSQGGVVGRAFSLQTSEFTEEIFRLWGFAGEQPVLSFASSADLAMWGDSSWLIIQALRAQSLNSLSFFLAALLSLWDLSSPTRDWTWATALKAPSPNHWTAGEFPLELWDGIGKTKNTYEEYCANLSWKNKALFSQFLFSPPWEDSTCVLPTGSV